VAKIIVGIAIGIVLSAVAFTLVDPPTDRLVLSRVSTSDVIVPVAFEDDATIASESSDSYHNKEDSPASESTAVSRRVSIGGEPTSGELEIADYCADEEARLIRQLEQARDAAEVAGYELADFRIARNLAANEVISPTPLPAEFDWVAEQRYPNMFHENFQREPIDVVWSSDMESKFLQFIYARPEAPVDLRALHDGIVTQMPDAFDCEDNPCFPTAYRENGITTIFWGTTRKVDRTQSLIANASE
jgi:hypothetical protein